MLPSVSIFWFRRDLRLDDNAGLYHALKSGTPVLPVFIFDKNILEDLSNKNDKRVKFIHDTISELHASLHHRGSTIKVIYDTPLQAFQQLTTNYNVAAVYTNHDYEPYARQRDQEVAKLLHTKGIQLNTFKDQVIFERDEILKDNGQPYTVFTPYSRKWKEKLNSFYLKSYPTQKYFHNLYQCPPLPLPDLHEIGFLPAPYSIPPPVLNETIVAAYDKTRDIPSIDGTSRMSVHLRFGTVSIRMMASQAKQLNQTYLNEIIWREFYMCILWHFPQVVTQSFKPEYDQIAWRNNESEYSKWCNGQTGYPIVDAGMRQLNATGYMHNRVRMIVASFLTKHLLIDWRWGEAYFAEKLLDFDLSANNGGWQWAAGCGCDAAPYFRVFNPYLQTEKFDAQLKYISKWVPEYADFSYPKPIVEHKFARERCLQTYKTALSKQT